MAVSGASALEHRVTTERLTMFLTMFLTVLLAAPRLPQFSGQRLAAVAGLLWGFGGAGLSMTYMLHFLFKVRQRTAACVWQALRYSCGRPDCNDGGRQLGKAAWLGAVPCHYLRKAGARNA